MIANGFVWTTMLWLMAVSCSLSKKKNERARQEHWLTEQNRIAAALAQLHTDLEKTMYLRTYCSQLTDIGRPDPATIRLYRSTTFDAMQLNEFYPLFERDSIPADCRITSYFYIRLAQSFGYNCYQYSFGFTEGPYAKFIHSFPIVEINYKGQQRMIVQDPYLNLMFRNKAGEPIDFYEFLKLLKQKKYDAIVMDSQTVETHLLVSDTTLYWPYLNDSCKSLMRNMIIQPDGSVLKKIAFQRNYRNLMQSICDNFEQQFVHAMHAHNYDEPFLYAYTLRVNTMAGSADVKTVEAKIDSILKNTVVDNRF